MTNVAQNLQFGLRTVQRGLFGPFQTHADRRCRPCPQPATLFSGPSIVENSECKMGQLASTS